MLKRFINKNIFINIILLFSSSSISLLALIEFNYRINYNYKTVKSRYEYNKDLVYFCKGKESIKQDIDREYISGSNLEYFSYLNNKPRLVSTDQYGYRINDTSINKNQINNKSKKYIWLFGDSFTFGTLADNTETIPSQLELMSGNKTIFRNFGQGGNGTKNAILHFKWALNNLTEKPEKAIFIGYHNDILDNLRTEINLKNYKFGIESRISTGPSWHIFNEINSFILKLIPTFYQNKIIAFKIELKKLFTNYKQAPLINNNNKINKLINYIKKDIYEFLRISKDNKIPPVIVFLRSQYNKATGEKEYIKALEEISIEKNVPFLIISNELLEKELKGETISSLYGFPDQHLNEKGYHYVAKLIGKFINNDELNLNYRIDFSNRTSFKIGSESCPK